MGWLFLLLMAMLISEISVFWDHEEHGRVTWIMQQEKRTMDKCIVEGMYMCDEVMHSLV